jgi:RNA polymerase sigma factor (sigma-70 family)
VSLVAPQLGAGMEGGEVRSDAELINCCLNGSEAAWSELIDKYQKLIVSIPIRYGFTQDEAADIFQAVCLDLLRDLARLREVKAFPKWLIEVTSHKCYHWKQRRKRVMSGGASEREPLLAETAPGADAILDEVEHEQVLREVFASSPSRCQKIIRMLFFEEPAPRYKEVAERMQIALGSVSAIRQRCLDRLRKALDARGF